MTTATSPGTRRVEHVMGMPIVVDVRDEDVGDGVIDRMFEWFHLVDRTFSTYKDESEISRLRPRRSRWAGGASTGRLGYRVTRR